MTASAARQGGYPLAETWDADLQSDNPLDFPGYLPPRPVDESVRTGLAELDGRALVVIESSFEHAGGTMGLVAGERIVRAFDRARDRELPVAAFVASGGARLQEGMFALAQMARTASAVHRHRQAGLQFVAVLRAHTTGGVYASWASLADLIAAEPGAIVGFGGPRVVATVTGAYPGHGSHTAEAAYADGRVDALLSRGEQLAWVQDAIFGPSRPLELPADHHRPPHPGPVAPDGWQAVERARSANRPSGIEWASWLCDGWLEIRGADPSLRAGIATLDGQRCVVVATDRHAHGDAGARQQPAGFRLAQRAIGLADRLALPVLTFIDTPGAEPGPDAEAQDVAGEIARTLLAMSAARVPTVALCVGEGGSGGALALAHTDRLYLLAGAVFCVISPDAGAAVLYHDAAQAPRLARTLRLTAAELLAFGVIDAILGDDDRAAVRATLADAVRTAQPGQRDLRIDRLSRRHLARQQTSEDNREVAG